MRTTITALAAILFISTMQAQQSTAPDGKTMAVAVKTDPTFQARQPVELFQTPLTPEAR